MQRDVRHRDDRERTAERGCAAEAADPERDGGGKRSRRRQRAGRNRTLRLDRVLPVALAVRDVVDEIDHARQHAEDDERADRVDDRVRIEELEAEQQSREDEQVLRPLSGPQRDEDVEGKRAPPYCVDCRTGGRHW